MKTILSILAIFLYFIGTSSIASCQEFRYLELNETGNNSELIEETGVNKTTNVTSNEILSDLIGAINKKVKSEKKEFSNLFFNIISNVGSSMIEYVNRTRIIN
ncbi:hypothetical protein FG379_003653 [Cryptosporidium bovis]|uniref:uncharacterized protein n=1 Tax=Cryptosporidium bovis TaxID=310047 RepID=UPI00351A4154|nr:hypothetical protein FG379_003653 [Cryptosporidium bovis]